MDTVKAYEATIRRVDGSRFAHGRLTLQSSPWADRTQAIDLGGYGYFFLIS